MRRHIPFIIMLGLLAAILSACAEEGSATSTIESYLKAKVASDAGKLTNLACNAWEAQASLAAAPFESVKAEIKDLSCKENGKDGDYTLVSCEGQIVVEYDGETRQLDVSETTYRAIKEDDEWKMCGEQ